jgi:hypothetical protein
VWLLLSLRRLLSLLLQTNLHSSCLSKYVPDDWWLLDQQIPPSDGQHLPQRPGCQQMHLVFGVEDVHHHHHGWGPMAF